MLFSVIVPVYNAELTLDECVGSVLGAESRNFELILVNDGSRDNSAALCDAFVARDARVAVIHQENQGLACARNAGMRRARGDYLVHLDCDDTLAPDALARIAEAIGRRPDAEGLVWRIIQRFPDAMVPETVEFPDTRDACLTGAEAFQFLFCSGIGSLWQSFRFVVRRSVVLERNLFYRPGVLHEDIDFNPFLVLQLRKVHFCPEPYYIYRKGRAGSVTDRLSFARCQDILGIVARWVSLLPATGLDPALQADFLATLSRLLWDCLPCFQAFPREQRRLLFAGLRPQVHVLRRIRMPARSAAAKRLLLALLGVRGAAWALARLRRTARPRAAAGGQRPCDD